MKKCMVRSVSGERWMWMRGMAGKWVETRASYTLRDGHHDPDKDPYDILGDSEITLGHQLI